MDSFFPENYIKTLFSKMENWGKEFLGDKRKTAKLGNCKAKRCGFSMERLKDAKSGNANKKSP